MASVLLGAFAYEKFLGACESDLVNERKLIEIAEQTSKELSGKLKRTIKEKGYHGRSTAKAWLEEWYELQEGEDTHPNLMMTVERLQTILKSPDVGLNRLACDLVEREPAVPAYFNQTPSFPTEVGCWYPNQEYLSLLVTLGMTGSGKSSISNVLAGRKNNDGMFPTSQDPAACTAKIKCVNTYLLGDHSKPLAIVDTVGFNSSSENHDENAIEKLIEKLKIFDYVNMFLITFNGQTPRLKESHLEMLTLFEKMFSEEMWDHVAVVFTRLQMNKDQIARREEDGNTDYGRARKFMAEVAQHFPRANLFLLEKRIFFIDAKAKYAEEIQRAEQDIHRLYKLLTDMPEFPTATMKQVQTKDQKAEEWKKGKELLEYIESVATKTAIGVATGAVTGAAVGETSRDGAIGGAVICGAAALAHAIYQ